MKKMQRIMLLTIVLSLVGAASVFGDTIWGSYKGYSKVRVMVNNDEVKIGSNDVPGILFGNTTLLPLRAVADALDANVHWDASTQTAHLYKPNVHMFVSQDVEKDYSVKRPFGRIDQGKTSKFVVSAQVDNLKVRADGIKISIHEPDDRLATTPLEVKLEKYDESFWYTYPFEVKFSAKGNYIVKFSLLVNNTYSVVSEKFIYSE